MITEYKAISKQTFELCFNRAVSGLESQALDGFKGHKYRNTLDSGDIISRCGFRSKICVQSCPSFSKILGTPLSLVCAVTVSTIMYCMWSMNIVVVYAHFRFRLKCDIMGGQAEFATSCNTDRAYLLVIYIPIIM